MSLSPAPIFMKFCGIRLLPELYYLKPAVFVTMQLLRAIILIIALVVQALPVAAVTQGEAPPKCGMACCAAHTMPCCCAAPAQTPLPPAPVSTPPVTGREMIPATLWVAFTPFLPLETATAEATTRFHERRADTQPHVRLPVLFCAILI